MLGYNPNMISTAQTNSFGSNKEMGRAAGPIIPYDFKELKPKKQLKEIRKVLLPEKKKFIFKYGFKFNLQYRCVICGSQQKWEISDPMRPLKGTYCPKHAGIHKQMEMLEQQILAEEHGLEFRAYLPKPRVPTFRRGPITDLSQVDMTSLISTGWVIEPPKGTKETPKEQYVRLMAEMQGKMKQIENLIGLVDE